MRKIVGFLSGHKLETFTIAFFLASILFISVTIHSCVQSINEAGGLRVVVVESGKEIKLLANDIDEAYKKEKTNP